MLIRTIDELEALPEGAVVRECRPGEGGDGYTHRVWQRADTPGVPGAGWYCVGLSGGYDSEGITLPAQLIHPRRYGDEDVERVAKMFARNLEDWCVESLPDEEPAPWFETARAALDALEGK